MSSQWTWTYLDAEAKAMTGKALAVTAFPSQSEAESWLGEQWRELADMGVDAVTLEHDGAVVYGPMNLRPAQ